jgi:membrane-associated protein
MRPAGYITLHRRQEDLVLATLSDRLIDLVTASAWAYAIVLALVALDAIVPLVPGEAVVIAAAVLAAEGELLVAFVAAAALAGSFAGDNASFGIGAGVGVRAAHRLLGGARGRRLLAWAAQRLRRHGGAVIVAARFVPGGRTATTFTAGAVGMSWQRFATADALAALLWSLYATGLGYLGGATFQDEEWKALALSLAIAALVAAAGETTRRVRLRGSRA